MTYQNSFRFGVHLRHFCLFYIVEVMPHLFGFPLINMIFQTKGQLQETEKVSVYFLNNQRNFWALWQEEEHCDYNSEFCANESYMNFKIL